MAISAIVLTFIGACAPSQPASDTAAIAPQSSPATALAPTAAKATAEAPGQEHAFASTSLQNPIMFVTQVPTPGDQFATRLSTFANHLPAVSSVPRGGDLMIRYPTGALRNLTREAGYGMDDLQGANAIAVREPTVHWDGTKAIFSMLVGAPAQYGPNTSRWQMYQVTGLAQGQNAAITKVPGQPAAYNNVSPFYGSDDSILFTSDRPRGGEAHLYPSLDEYESTATITGIYRLDPTGNGLTLLNHTPSGAFTPIVDSYGRVLFTRWDHLQRDQQQDAGTAGSFNYASEVAGAPSVGVQAETFPEARRGMTSPYGPVGDYLNNLFMPWQMNQDGTEELTLNHIGRHETSFGYLGQSFTSDPALRGDTNQSIIANRKYIRHDGGLFHIKEDPTTPGTYYAINTPEFGTLTTNQIVRISGAPTLNAEQMQITDATPAPSGGNLPGGRFRNPLPTASGHMVASYTPSPVAQAGITLRLHQLTTSGSTLAVGTALTPGIVKSVRWWSPDVLRSFNGALWEIEPVEVVEKPRPPVTSSPQLESPERSIMTAEGVDEGAFRSWLRQKNLAVLVTRNQTSRDRADLQQPFNLRVPGGVQKVRDGGILYDIAHYQVLQANMVRGYSNFANGRRPVAQPIAVTANPASGGPAGSVPIAADGSTAVFVPANRALAWQTVNPSGVPVVRERVWVTMQPGEIRTCAGCHGENARNQAGQAEPTNPPEALRALLRHWKATNGGGTITPRNGSVPKTPGGL